MGSIVAWLFGLGLLLDRHLQMIWHLEKLFPVRACSLNRFSKLISWRDEAAIRRHTRTWKINWPRLDAAGEHWRQNDKARAGCHYGPDMTVSQCAPYDRLQCPDNQEWERLLLGFHTKSAWIGEKDHKMTFRTAPSESRLFIAQ